jgi:LysM repeat protein
MKKSSLAAAIALCAVAAFAQGNRDSFVQQQAYAEMQRVSGQIDVLQSNLDDISSRLAKLERSSSSGDLEVLRSRIASLEETVASLRKDLANQRGEIVKDLSARIAKMPQASAPKQTQQAKSAEQSSGPYREYVVASGDNLWLIAKAFNTTVPKIREMNGLKNDSLKVGQKIKLPME